MAVCGGALLNKIQFLKNPGKYKSVSAYAPIANPSKCPWGEKAFSGYLDGKSEWADHDATELVKKWNGGPLDILIDVVRLAHSSTTLTGSALAHQPYSYLTHLLSRRNYGSSSSSERFFNNGDQGTSDNFYHQGQLLPENFQKAAAEKGDGGVRIRFQEGYDHSYFTMATFADDHVGHAARYLLG